MNSYKNSLKSEGNLKFVPRKPSHRKRYGIRWRDNNEVFPFEKDEMHQRMKGQMVPMTQGAKITKWEPLYPDEIVKF